MSRLPSRVRDVLPGPYFERLASVRAFDEWIHASPMCRSSASTAAHRLQGAAVHPGVLPGGAGAGKQAGDRKDQAPPGPSGRHAGCHRDLRRATGVPNHRHVGPASGEKAGAARHGSGRSRGGRLPGGQGDGDPDVALHLPAGLAEDPWVRVQPAPGGSGRWLSRATAGKDDRSGRSRGCGLESSCAPPTRASGDARVGGRPRWSRIRVRHSSGNAATR